MVSEKTTACPKCKASWVGESILQSFIKQRDEGKHYVGLTDEQIEEKMKESYSPPYHWMRQIAIEDRSKYDGVSYWRCPDCGATFDRWTGEEVEI